MTLQINSEVKELTSDTFDVTIDNSSFTGDFWWDKWTVPSTTAYNYTTWYPTTIYMYQIQCPRCQKMNWAQLDQVKECATPKCKAKLRAVEKKEDYTVEITT